MGLWLSSPHTALLQPRGHEVALKLGTEAGSTALQLKALFRVAAFCSTYRGARSRTDGYIF